MASGREAGGKTPVCLWPCAPWGSQELHPLVRALRHHTRHHAGYLPHPSHGPAATLADVQAAHTFLLASAGVPPPGAPGGDDDDTTATSPAWGAHLDASPGVQAVLAALHAPGCGRTLLLAGARPGAAQLQALAAPAAPAPPAGALLPHAPQVAAALGASLCSALLAADELCRAAAAAEAEAAAAAARLVSLRAAAALGVVVLQEEQQALAAAAPAAPAGQLPPRSPRASFAAGLAAAAAGTPGGGGGGGSGVAPLAAALPGALVELLGQGVEALGAWRPRSAPERVLFGSGWAAARAGEGVQALQRGAQLLLLTLSVPGAVQQAAAAAAAAATGKAAAAAAGGVGGGTGSASAPAAGSPVWSLCSSLLGLLSSWLRFAPALGGQHVELCADVSGERGWPLGNCCALSRTNQSRRAVAVLHACAVQRRGQREGEREAGDA